jgi:hypothetical protein
VPRHQTLASSLTVVQTASILRDQERSRLSAAGPGMPDAASPLIALAGDIHEQS